METIILQIALELVEKITKMTFENISDLDTLTSDVLAECKASARSILEAVVDELNRKIRTRRAASAAGLLL